MGGFQIILTCRFTLSSVFWILHFLVKQTVEKARTPSPIHSILCHLPRWNPHPAMFFTLAPISSHHFTSSLNHLLVLAVSFNYPRIVDIYVAWAKDQFAVSSKEKCGHSSQLKVDLVNRVDPKESIWELLVRRCSARDQLLYHPETGFFIYILRTIGSKHRVHWALTNSIMVIWLMLSLAIHHYY